MHTETDVLFSEIPGQRGNLGVITLNRSKALNSLNLAMVHAMHKQLKQWNNDETIKAVIIQAQPDSRAFCAGGDLKGILNQFHKDTTDEAETDFFRDEYQLNRYIHHYPKPYIALLDGITMGGGVGISIHGSHRVATEKLLFAMPETGIGFFPDVGGTYFLPRIKNNVGYYLGLTGARIKADDCVHLGIAQIKTTSENIVSLVAAIATQDLGTNPKNKVSEIIQTFGQAPTPTALQAQTMPINELFAHENMEDIFHALEKNTADFSQQTLKFLKAKSPTSLKVTLKALRMNATLSFDACMQQEYRLSCRFLQGHDFYEGIRAVIIDKDNQPHWQPTCLTNVTDSDVEKYFSPVTKELA